MAYPDSHDLNFSNRLVRTRMPGGVAGVRLTAAPYADQRKKDIIIRGGFNISAAEVENLLLGHPDIKEAACVAEPHEILGERVLAFIVPKDQKSPPSLKAVVNFLKGLGVASYKLPERLESIEAIPRNPVGRILKATLKQRLIERST